MVSRDIYARDLRRAKEQFVEKVKHYAPLILDPVLGKEDYTLHVNFVRMGDLDEAEAVYYDDAKILDVYVNEDFEEANMHNMKSRHMDGLIIHEMCHLKEYLTRNFGRHHGTKSYRKCILEHGADKTWTAGRTHAHKYSIRHYMGSENGVVPRDILYIWAYYCPREDMKFIENVLATKRKEITTCLSCGGPVHAMHLDPRTVHTYFTDKDIGLSE